MATESSLRIEKLKQEFSQLQTWEDKYKQIIQWGKEMPPMAENLKTEEAKVKGCQSQVWLHAEFNENKLVEFKGDSDALIVRGLVAVLLRVYSGLPPAEIQAVSPDFLRDLGFSENLSPSRTNGLMAMIKQIKMFAFVFQNWTR